MDNEFDSMIQDMIEEAHKPPMYYIKPKNHPDYFRTKQGTVITGIRIVLAKVPDADIMYTSKEADEFFGTSQYAYKYELVQVMK